MTGSPSSEPPIVSAARNPPDDLKFSLSGCTAIVTGASSGLGAEFARQLSLRATCLILAARSADPLESLAQKLRLGSSSLRVIVCPCDLATDEGRSTLWTKVDAEGVAPDVLINNAGLGDYGEFAAADPRRVRQQIEVNVTALTMLAHEFARRVTNPARGFKPAALLNLSSLASTLPIPELAVYAATKAYVSSLSEALAIELAPKNVYVLAVCPGPSPTNFGSTARRAGDPDIDRSRQSLIQVSPQTVVSTSLHALQSGKVRHFPGNRVAVAAFVIEKMPRTLLRLFLRFREHRKK
jgi:short-subunit dehydrogenase